MDNNNMKDFKKGMNIGRWVIKGLAGFGIGAAVGAAVRTFGQYDDRGVVMKACLCCAAFGAGVKAGNVVEEGIDDFYDALEEFLDDIGLLTEALANDKEEN